MMHAKLVKDPVKMQPVVCIYKRVHFRSINNQYLLIYINSLEYVSLIAEHGIDTIMNRECILHVLR